MRKITHLLLAWLWPVSSQQQDGHKDEENKEGIGYDIDDCAEYRCLLWSGANQRWVEAGNDEARSTPDINGVDELMAGNVEHGHITAIECYKAELSIAGNGD